MSKNQQETRYDKWRTLIEEHEKSGLSQKDFCQEKNISPSKFTYYKSCIQGKVAQKENLFSPVRIQKSYTSADVQIILPNGIKCIVPCAIDTVYAKRIVEVLLSC